MKHVLRAFGLSLLLYCLPQQTFAQRYLTEYDSSLFIRDTVRTLVKRMENISISGYMQPQFQVAQKEGAPSYNGGNFSEFSNSRFMLRRARVKIDYRVPSKRAKLPIAVFTYQVDATERGVVTRDMFTRLYEPKYQNFSLLIGLFARPFGYEINLSSSVREAPERGRMSQILMPSERDLGAMISYEAQNKKGTSPIKFDIGLFNGQGLSGTAEFDRYKDLISRLTIKPFHLSSDFIVSGGLSYLNGGWRQATKYKYEIADNNGTPFFKVDSSSANIGHKAPRRYHGADVQLVHKYLWGKTELRAEYWRGMQPGISSTSTNPGTLPLVPTYIRHFDGAFIMFLQNIGNKKNELLVKYDWYDPNTKVAAAQIGKAGSNLTAADIKFSTLGVGYVHYFNEHVKWILYYDLVKNEKTQIAGFTQDIKDNIFTCRVHFIF